MCAAGKLSVQAGSLSRGAGQAADPRLETGAHQSASACGDSLCVGVILGFPREVAQELQKWRASFGDPMADVIPAHITLVTTTPAQDWEATLEHVRDVARRQTPFKITISGTGSSPETPRRPSRIPAIQPSAVNTVTTAAMAAVQPRPVGFRRSCGSTRPLPPLVFRSPGAAVATLETIESTSWGCPLRTKPVTANPVASRPVMEKNMVKPMPALRQ